MKLSRKMVIPLALVSFVTLIVFGVTSYSYMSREVRSLHTTQIRAAIDTLEDEILLSREVEDLVLTRFDEKNLALARALAEIISYDAERLLEYEEMDRLAQLLGVDEVHVIDGDGYLLWGNEPEYYGMDFDTTDQTRAFLDILRDPSLELAQEPMPNGSRGWWYQYAGVHRIDERGVVQVGIPATVIQELSRILNVGRRVEILSVGQNGHAAILKNGMFIAHQDLSRIGLSMEEEPWYQELLSTDEDYLWLSMDDEDYFAGYSFLEEEGMILLAMIPHAEYYASLNHIRNSCILLTLIATLVLITVLLLCIRRFIIRPIDDISDALEGVSSGKVKSLPERTHDGEFGDLNQAIQRTVQQFRLREDLSLDLLARISDMRDGGAGDHYRRITGYVQIFVDHLLEHPREGYLLDPVLAQDIVRSVKLHDLGKIAVPDHILLKPGKLSPEEFHIVRQHTTRGAALLDEFIPRPGKDAYLSTARDIVLHHHEKWDGSGYPAGLAGNAIPLSARIAAIADVYDALTSERPYKRALPHQRCVEIILEERERHFDPWLVDIFQAHQERFEAILLSGG